MAARPSGICPDPPFEARHTRALLALPGCVGYLPRVPAGYFSSDADTAA